jgi:hypothetical protein
MPRFSIKDLFIATTLVAVGVGALCVLFSREETPVIPGLILFFGGSALIGAGIFMPFKWRWVGAGIGVLFAAIILAVVVWVFLRNPGLHPLPMPDENPLK